MLVAGVQSGWPIDFLEALKVRRRHQIHGDIDDEGELVAAKLPDYLDRVVNQVKTKDDEDLKTDVSLLLAEFLALSLKTDGKEKPVEPAVYPLYHDPDVRAATSAGDEEPKEPTAPLAGMTDGMALSRVRHYL